MHLTCGHTEAIDEIYVVNRNDGDGVKKWTHVVTVTGFDVLALYPFWEFQNSFSSTVLCCRSSVSLGGSLCYGVGCFISEPFCFLNC